MEYGGVDNGYCNLLFPFLPLRYLICSKSLKVLEAVPIMQI